MTKKRLNITLDMYPDSWKKRAMAGEKISVPGTAAFNDYLEQLAHENLDHAEATMVAFARAFRDAYNTLECYPMGTRRMEKALNELGKKINRMLFKAKQMGDPLPTCKANCSACCHISVSLTDSEAIHLVDYLKAHDIKLDKELVLEQSNIDSTEEHVKIPWERRRCPILGEDGNCRAYEARPLVCRKYFVASPPWMCDMRLSQRAAIMVNAGVEGIVAAQMALERPEKESDDYMPKQLLKRIAEDDRIWK